MIKLKKENQMNKATRMLALAGQISKSAIIDGWENLFTGLGVKGKDKTTGGKVNYQRFSETELDDIYDGDDVAQRVVDLIPEEGTREWIAIKINGDEKTEELITDAMESLKMQSKTEEAWKLSRHKGGSGIFLSVDDGLDLGEPLNLNRTSRLNSLTVLDRYELHANTIDRDIESPNFGMPETYNISPKSGESTTNIHHTRIIRFEGKRVSRRSFINNGYWNDSVLVRLYQVLRNFNLSHNSIASILQDFNVGILKLKNLAELIGADEENLVQARLRLMNLSKSVVGSILLDAEDESFENQTVSLANLDKVIDKVNERLVAATDMPHTKVLGNGSTGSLSGAGESEEKDWKAEVGNQQQSVIKDPIDVMLNLLLMTKQGPTNGKIPNDFEWEFNPLWMPTDKEKSESRERIAKADEIYMKYGAVAPREIAESRFGGEEYSMEIKLDPKAFAEQKKTELIDPKEAEKLIKGDDIEPEFNQDNHWHTDPLNGNTGPAKGHPTSHWHVRPNGSVTGLSDSASNDNHMHETAHGDTGPAVKKESE